MPNPWPHGAKCAISLTMDNLGEAQAVHNKTWPAGRPTGQDPSVLQTLPRILDILATAGVRATYFAEAWSLAAYPAAVAALTRAGHEVAWHGFQHEPWHALSADEEQASFERSFAAAEGAGVVYRGFRPPGGRINGGRTLGLCAAHGVEYVSPLGEFGILSGGGGGGDVVVLPFEWEAVDAFWYMDKFAGVRREHGVDGEGPLGPAEFRVWLVRRIEETKAEGGFMSVLFHPFLTTDEDKMGLLGEIAGLLGRDGEVWCAPCGEVAGWVREHRAEFGF